MSAKIIYIDYAIIGYNSEIRHLHMAHSFPHNRFAVIATVSNPNELVNATTLVWPNLYNLVKMYRHIWLQH